MLLSCLKSFSSALPPPLSAKSKPNTLGNIVSMSPAVSVFSPFAHRDLHPTHPRNSLSPPQSCVLSYFHTFAHSSPIAFLRNCLWLLPTPISARNFLPCAPFHPLLITYHCWCLFFLPLVSKLLESRSGLFIPVPLVPEHSLLLSRLTE